jgi:hypothetical protein
MRRASPVKSTGKNERRGRTPFRDRLSRREADRAASRREAAERGGDAASDNGLIKIKFKIEPEPDG